MTDRAAQIDSFLASTAWADASRASLAGDASLRRYLRIGASATGVPAVLMDADPALGNDVAPFLHITEHLRELGLSAPKIYHASPEDGLLLIEDLGDDLFARVVARDPDMEQPLYAAATDVLIALHAAPAPSLADYDTQLMTRMAALAFDWYQRGVCGAVDGPAKHHFESRFAKLLDTEVGPPSVLIQRDYHAENLLWLPDRTGVARVGLLDYQDAMLGHPAYDLVSLLQDARRDVTPQVETLMIARYCDAAGLDPEHFARAYHVLGLQRNLRILGVFARLSMHFGKPHYVDWIPRVWSLIARNLNTPVCAPLAADVQAAFPAPTAAILQGLKEQCATVPSL